MFFLRVWRTGLLFLSLAFPAAALGTAVGGIPAGIACAVVVAGALAVLGFKTEQALARVQGASWALPMGLAKTLECACGRSALPIPKLGVFPSASPTAIVVKNFGGNGLVLVSQALVALLSEEQLRAVLHRCAAEVMTPGMTLRSIAATLALTTLRVAPRSWTALFFSDQPIGSVRSRQLTPAYALLFLLVLPLIRLLLGIGKPLPGGQMKPAVPDPFFDQAFRRVQKHHALPGVPDHTISIRPLCVIP